MPMVWSSSMTREDALTMIVVIEAIAIVILFMGFFSMSSIVTQANNASLQLIDMVNRTGEFYRFTNEKINILIDAHNREVHSWYVGNRHIKQTTNEFFKSMHNATENSTMLDSFNDCVAKIDYPYMISAPHLSEDDVAEGYVIELYDKETMEYVGKVTFAKTFASYYTTECGIVYYNMSSKILEFIPTTLTVSMG